METDIVKKKDVQEFETLLEKSFKKNNLKESTIIKAKISEIGKKFVLCEIENSKFEGAVPVEEFRQAGELENLKVNDTVELFLDRIENFRQEIVVSRIKARQMKSLNKVETLFKDQAICEGVITGKLRGGYWVSIDGLTAFLPGSQVGYGPVKNMDTLMNTKQKFKIVKLEKERGSVVVSRKAVLAQSREKEINEFLSKIKEGDIVTGTIKSTVEYGCFVDVMGVDTLCHITDMAFTRVNKPTDILNVGDKRKFKVIKIDPLTKKVSLSIKALSKDPFEDIDTQFEVGKVYLGQVSKLMEFGAFISLLGPDGRPIPGLEGLCHTSQLSFLKKNIDPRKVLSTSEKVKVRILDIDKVLRRISLSYKDNGELINPWESFVKDYPLNSIVKGKISGIDEKLGLFVKIDKSELTGFIHKTQISFDKSLQTPKNFKKGADISAKLVLVDQDKEKILLSPRLLNEKDPFEFWMTKEQGQTVTTTVSEVLKNGIKVYGGKDKNFIITIKKNDLAKELSDQRAEIYQKGDSVDSLLVSIDKLKRTVSLSIKELEIQNEKKAIEKYGKEGSSSGAVLGDILGKVFKSKKKKEKK